MKTWFHNRKMRSQCAGTQSPVPPPGSTEYAGVPPVTRQLQAFANSKSPMRIAVPAMASRMSIERYLSAPLSDEPATAPAIDAALRKQVPREWIDSPANLYHSRDTSVDVHSDGRPTFFTNGSIPDTVDTSYTADSRSKFHRKMISNDTAGQNKTRWIPSDRSEIIPPSRPMTSHTVGPVDVARDWAQKVEKNLPNNSPVEYRAKAEQEIWKIQEKARELELMMQRFRVEQHAQERNQPRTTDESARAMMAANPKLAWILGGENVESTNATTARHRPTTISTTDDIPDIPSSIGAKVNDMPPPPPRIPRRAKSSSALSEEPRSPPPPPPPMPNSPAALIERQTSKRHRFFCTFCQKRFSSRLDWLRHERTIHMPEELWVCCPRTGSFPSRCPFCERNHPSPAHLADHNYLSCQEKPLSERTFGRKDHFLQHISLVHKVAPGQKPARLTELESAWRHPLPIEIGDRALHCGFCGRVFGSYQERTEHVGRHFAEGEDMMSWWKERVSHDAVVEDGNGNGGGVGSISHHNSPHQCAYCERTFKTLGQAQKMHPVCTMWSCSFLPGLQYTMFPGGSPRRTEAICCYCNDSLAQSTDGKVNGALLKDHMTQHNFRACNQTLYFSGQRFRQHLYDSHRTSYDATLFGGWTLLLKSSRRKTPSLFQLVEPKSFGRRSTSDAGGRKSTSDAPNSITTKGSSKGKKSKKQYQEKDKDIDRERTESTPINFMEWNELPPRVEPNKLRRKQSGYSTPDTFDGEPRPPLQQPRPSMQQPRPSLQVFARSGLAADGSLMPEEPPAPSSRKGAKRIVAPTPSGAPVCPTFYRRRLDASTRNRLFMDANDELAPGDTQALFRRVQGSVLGGLVLHSSLVAAVPALMTNCVDVYSLE